MKSRSKYRNRLQIVADILYIVKDGSRKTRIMFEANLSYRLLLRYLDTIMRAGLVCLNDSSEYVITPKGRAFLEKFSEYSRRVDHIASDRILLEHMCFVPQRGSVQRVRGLTIDASS